MTGRYVPRPERALEFTFDGEDYTLVYDMKAIAFFEREADVSIVEAMDAMERAQMMQRPPKISHLAFLLQAGLARHHPEVDLDMAMGMAGDPQVLEALGASLGESIGGDDEPGGGTEGNVPRPAQKRGTGKTSGRKPGKRRSTRKPSGG